MEIIIEMLSWVFVFSNDLFDFTMKDGKKSHLKVFISMLIYILNILMFLIFLLIAFSMLKVVIKNFQISWELLLLALFIVLTTYFGRNVVGYTLQILDNLT
ncbi:MAG: hypothetical protein ACK5NA_04500 [Enterococcus sp.]